MGLYPIFLLMVIPHMLPNIWPLEDVVGMKFGNVKDREEAVRRRQLRMAVEALHLFQSVRPITSQSVMSIFSNDDAYLSTEQLTEFWAY